MLGFMFFRGEPCQEVGRGLAVQSLRDNKDDIKLIQL